MLGTTASQGLSRMFSKPSRIMPPQVGVGGLTPRPMNASDASVRIALASQSDPITRISARDVGQDVDDDDPRVGIAERAAGVDELPLA